MSTVYAYELSGTNDQYLKIAREALGRLGRAVFPGTFIVNTFPTLRFLPEWLPGITFWRFANDTRPYADAMKNLPFDIVKKGMVSCNISVMKRSDSESFCRLTELLHLVF